MKADSNSPATPQILFEAEFEALLEELTSTTGEPEPITKLEEEIEQLKGEVSANLKRHAITPEELQRTYAHLSKVRDSLKGSQDRLESFINAKEVGEIEAARERAAQNQAKMERIARFDEYFLLVSEAMEYIAQVKENYREQRTEEAIEWLGKAKNILEMIANSKELLFPNKLQEEKDRSQISGQHLESVSADFDFVLGKLETETSEWTEALTPESAKSTSEKAEGNLERESTKNIPHREFIIQAKKILVSGASSFSEDSNFLADLISSEEVLASFKYNDNNSKSRLPPLKISRFMVDIKDVVEEMTSLFTLSSLSSEEEVNSKLLLAKDAFTDLCELLLRTSPYLFAVCKTSETPREPRRSALAHNNLLFFAFLIENALSSLQASSNTKNSKQPQKNLLSELSKTYTSALKDLASGIFRGQMQYEEARLLTVFTHENSESFDFKSALAEIANETPSTELKVSSAAHYALRAALNDALRLLGSLHKAFVLEVALPERLSSRAFSTLVSSLLSAFLAPIIELGDISSLGASHLSHELDYFSSELKPFLGGDSAVSVSKWIKLNEVNFILKSSLLEIVNRWAEGSGILASYLTAEEVKHLMRALFQNTERRSAALAKIK